MAIRCQLGEDGNGNDTQRTRLVVPGGMTAAVILFDFYGTIARGDRAVWGDAYLPLLRRHGFSGSPEEAAAAWGRVWEGVDPAEGIDHSSFSVSAEAYDEWRGSVEALALARLGFARAPAELIAELLEIQDQREYSLYEDVVPTLAALRARGYRLGIVSNFNWQLPAIAERLGLMPYLERVIVSARVGYRKPHPEIFRQALAAFGVREQEAVYVGDSLRIDVQGARRAGLSAVLLDRDGAYDVDAPAVRSLSDLLDLHTAERTE